jgi:hypothetical protein
VNGFRSDFTRQYGLQPIREAAEGGETVTRFAGSWSPPTFVVSQLWRVNDWRSDIVRVGLGLTQLCQDRARRPSLDDKSYTISEREVVQNGAGWRVAEKSHQTSNVQIRCDPLALLQFTDTIALNQRRVQETIGAPGSTCVQWLAIVQVIKLSLTRAMETRPRGLHRGLRCALDRENWI